MVRINLINPSSLSDQHLIAEYNEILMLIGYVKKHPSIEDLPKKYSLGKGHIRFFKDKLGYLKRRHERIKREMMKRGFKTSKRVMLGDFPRKMRNDWKPKKEDKETIKKRLIQRLREKPWIHTYYGERLPLKEMVDMIKNSD